MMSGPVRLVNAGLVVLTVVGGTAAAWLGTTVQPQQRDAPSFSPLVRTTSLAGIPRLGGASARVAVVMFSDFSCPFCREFSHTAEPRLRTDFVDSGLAVLAFRQFPLEAIHPAARAAAIAALCSDQQNQFWPMERAMFLADPTTNGIATAMANTARAQGVDLTVLSACTTGADVRERLASDIREADRLGVKSTPTFLIGSVTGDSLSIEAAIDGAAPYAQLQRVLERLGARSR